MRCPRTRQLPCCDALADAVPLPVAPCRSDGEFRGDPRCFLFSITRDVRVPYQNPSQRALVSRTKGVTPTKGKSPARKGGKRRGRGSLATGIGGAYSSVEFESLRATRDTLEFGKGDLVLRGDFSDCESRLEGMYSLGLDSKAAKVRARGGGDPPLSPPLTDLCPRPRRRCSLALRPSPATLSKCGVLRRRRADLPSGPRSPARSVGDRRMTHPLRWASSARRGRRLLGGARVPRTRPLHSPNPSVPALPKLRASRPCLWMESPNKGHEWPGGQSSRDGWGGPVAGRRHPAPHGARPGL